MTVRKRRKRSRRHPLQVQLLEPRLPLAEDAFEPNDSFAEVDAAGAAANFGLVGDTRIQPALALEDADDYFRFETSATGTSHDFVQIDFEHDNGNLQLELFDSGGNQIGRSASVDRDLERVSLAEEPAGVYYARVLGTAGAANSNYALAIDPPGNSLDDFYEPNNERPVVDLQIAGATGSSNLGALTEQTQISNLRLEDTSDWYRFETTAIGTDDHFARIDFDNDYGNLQLELYDSAGNRIDRSISINNDHEQVSLASEPAGIYYVRVIGRVGSANSQYALTIFPPAATPLDGPEIELQVAESTIVSGQTDAISLGEVAQGETGPELSFDVTNSGSAPLTLENLTIPAGFTLLESPGSGIAAGQSDSFRLRLDSTLRGTRLGEVRFSTNDRDESEFKFLVIGTVKPTTDIGSGDIFEQNDDRFEVLAKDPSTDNSANLGVLLDKLVLPGQDLSDDDWFRFETIAQGTSHDFVQIEYDNEVGNLQLELFDGLGNLIDASRTNIEDVERVELAKEPAGVFYFRVYGQGGAVNPDYAITIDPPGNSLDDFYEPNEDRFEVDLQSSGGISSPNLGQLSEQVQISNLRLEDAADWYRFETSATGSLNHFARVEFEQDFGNLHLELYDSFGNILDSSRSDNSDSEQVSLANEPAGTYYARIYGDIGAANADYALTIVPPSATPPNQPEVVVQVDGTTLVSGQHDVVSFGSIEQIQPGTELTFSVHNIGRAPLLTESLAIPDGFTLVDSLQPSIAAGQSDTFRIRLNSDPIGTRFGEIRFASGDLDESEFKFPVVGTVTPKLSGAISDVFEENNDRFTVRMKTPGAVDSANLGVLLEPLQLSNQQLFDDDWFRFETIATGTGHDFVQIQFDSSNGNLNLELYDVNGNRTDRSTGGFSDTEQVELAARPQGVYYARVYGASGAVNANYAITFNPPGDSLDDAYEPNDDRFEVDLQTPGEVDSANLGVLNGSVQISDLRLEDDADWFRFEITATGTTDHFARIEFDNRLGDLELQLFDAYGERIDRLITGIGDVEEDSLSDKPAGIYYARVHGKGGAANPNYTFTLNPPGSPDTISLNVVPVSFDEADGSNAATATVTRSGSTSGDLTVNVASSDLSEASVPTFVVIPNGQSQQTFAVAAIDDDIVDAARTVSLTAWANQYVSGTATVFVTDSGDVNLPPTISDIGNVRVRSGTTIDPIDFTIADTHTEADLLSIEVSSHNLTLIPRANITLAGSGPDRMITLVPVANQIGRATITITITVTDPERLMTSESFMVTVDPINSRPLFTATDPPAVLEDSGPQIVNAFAAFSPGAPDESGQSVLAYVVSSISNPTLFATAPSIDTVGNLTYEPATDAFGSSTFEAAVQDNGGTAGGSNDVSEFQTFTVTVTGVNDAPGFAVDGVVTADEDSGAQTILGYAHDFDPGPNEDGGGASAQSIAAYTISKVSDSSLFSVLPQVDVAGTLSFTPANDANGMATFEILVQDDGGTENGGQDTSSVLTGTISITSINDPPTFSATDLPVVLQGSAPQSVAFATDFDPGPADESSQTLIAYAVTNISNPSLFSVVPSIDPSGNLTYTPNADVFGTSTFTVTAKDNGGTADGGDDTSTPQNFTIVISAPHDFGDAPSRYPVTLADDGARHTLGPLRLGAEIDGELDGQPSDLAGADGGDDDGVRVIASSIAISGIETRASFSLLASEAGMLDAWIDFRGDGDWDDPGEQIATNFALNSGVNTLSYTTPADAVAGTAAARFRLSTAGGLAPTGTAVDGEVEDYLTVIYDGNIPIDTEVDVANNAATLVNSNGHLVIFEVDQELFNAPFSNLNTLGLQGGSDFDNVLTLDFSGGSFLPQGGLNLNGVGGTNVLRLIGGDHRFGFADTGSFFASNFAQIDLSDPSVYEITLDAASVNALAPGSGSILAMGDEFDTIAFLDAKDWRMETPLVADGQFLLSAGNIAGGSETVLVDFPHDWQNVIRFSDVNNDGDVTVVDALRIINELSRREFSDPDTQELVDPLSRFDELNIQNWPNAFFDQNGDGEATAIDALRVINELARILLASSEFELPALDQAISELSRNSEDDVNVNAVVPELNSSDSPNRTVATTTDVKPSAGNRAETPSGSASVDDDRKAEGEMAVEQLLSSYAGRLR